MRKILLAGTLVLLLLVGGSIKAQDFSNKGKEFWLCFPSHIPSGGALANMALFITSDKNSSGIINVNGFSTTFSVTANQIAGPYSIPYNSAYVSEVGIIVNKGIHIKVDDGQPPVVVFAHIYAGYRSEASLILPVATLGRKYYSTNFWQASTSGSKSQFEIVATAPNTIVQYQLRRNGVLSATVNTATLANPGDVLQIQDDQDLTGSVIESIATPTASCNKIAVFSGSSSLSISRPGCTGNSYDPLYQQCYPVNTWGKNFGVVPLANNSAGYHVRITAAEDNSVVNLNGTNVTLNAGEYYPATSSNPTPFTGPLTISSDKPISVAQYLISSNCCGSTSIPGATQPQGDPDMIILNPVEQSISDINIFSSNLQNIRTKYLCVYMKTSEASSFRINNAAPASSFTPMPSGNGYSYLVEDLTSYPTQSFRLTANDGFNAITYGMGDAESYGYSAGTNVKDLYQFVSVDNDYATVDFPAACKGAPYYLSVTFPYQPTQISWQFNGLFPDVTLSNPVFDETSVVNGRTLYKYKLSNTFTTATAGTYPIKIIAQNPTADGCGGIQEIDYDLEVFELPTADFNFSTNGCVSAPTSFSDNSTTPNNRPITHWYWDFGDGNSQQDVSSTNHTYASANSYNVKYTVITDVGCKADTVQKTVVLNDPPVADFTIIAPDCEGKTITFKDGSAVTGSATITKWTWNFGDGTPDQVVTSNTDQTHSYTTAGSYNVTLQVETATGCLSTVKSKPITVHPNPVVAFNLPNVCLPAGSAQFTSSSSITDGTESQFSYLWDFGDASATVTGQSPTHNYTGTGPYNVTLTVTSGNSCVSTLTKQLTTIYPEPVADFNSPAEVCLGTPANFTDQSIASGSSVSQWQWNFGDQTTSTVQSPSRTYASPGTYSVTLSVTSAIGCATVNNIKTKTIIVNPLPVADFTASLPGCAGQDITFTNTSVANAGNITKWTWGYGDGSTAILSNGSSFIHNYAAVNTYTTTLQVETDKGCVSPVTIKDIVINPIPVAGFEPPDICVSDVAVPIADASTVSSGSVVAWQWNFGDANATSGNPNTSVMQNPSHHYTWPGNYTAELIVTSNAGCKDTVTHTVKVNGAVLTPAFTVENTTVLCSNNDITIKDGSQVDAGNIIRIEIFWDANNDLTNKTIDNSPATGKTYMHKYSEFGSPATKDYTIRYDIYSGVICVNSISKTITLLATPTLAFGSVLPVCSNDPSFQVAQVQLQNTLPGSGVFSGTGISSTGIFNPAIAGQGIHTITYTYTGDNGCKNSAEQTIEVYPTPVADAGPDKVVLEGGSVVLTPALIANIPVSYTWQPALWLDNPNIPNAETSPPTDFSYTLVVSSDKGCKTSDEVFVKLLKAPVIPNIFSPNGDGIHDKWVIEYLESYPGCVVQIYNRYGQMVFKTVNYTNPWDGKINGKDAPIGTYYYIIDPKNGRKPITGFVDIIR
jgi:gliding motility-associated-like protein